MKMITGEKALKEIVNVIVEQLIKGVLPKNIARGFANRGVAPELSSKLIKIAQFEAKGLGLK